jgi:hypothetical protein
VLQSAQHNLSDIVRGYPLKRRAVSALTTLAILLIVGLNRHFDWAIAIAIAAFTTARLFDLKGRWSIFFYGLGVGDLLLYVASAGQVGHWQ